MNIVILCSHVPDPRMSKRIRSLSKISSDLSVIYWDRTHGQGIKIEDLERIDCIKLDASNERYLVKRLLESKKLRRRSFEILNELSPELIYVSGIECMSAARKIKRVCGSHIVLEIADLPANSYIERFGFLSKPLEALVNREVSSADSMVITSPYYYSDYYKQKTRFRENEVFLFENVPEQSVYYGFKKKPHDVFRVAFIGGVRYFDSIRTLFEAAKGIDGLEVLIAGKGPDYERVLELSKTYSNAKITGEYNYKKEIVNLYSEVDLVYAVYNTKGINERLALPNKLYEAIVCGIPIVVSKGTCLEKYVKELGVGFSVSDGDVDELRTLFLDIIGAGNCQLRRISKKESEIKDGFFYENIEQKFLEWISAKVMSKTRGD
ncbi:MAG: glycosyltransferase [Mesotoga sp.]